MDKERLVEIIKTGSYTEAHLEELDDLVREYPWFGLPRFLRLKVFEQLEKSPEKAELNRAVVFSSDRKHLYKWVQGTLEPAIGTAGLVSTELEFLDDDMEASDGESLNNDPFELLVDDEDEADMVDKADDADAKPIPEKDETEMEEPEIDASDAVPVIDPLDDEEDEEDDWQAEAEDGYKEESVTTGPNEQRGDEHHTDQGTMTGQSGQAGEKGQNAENNIAEESVDTGEAQAEVKAGDKEGYAEEESSNQDSDVDEVHHLGDFMTPADNDDADADVETEQESWEGDRHTVNSEPPAKSGLQEPATEERQTAPGDQLPSSGDQQKPVPGDQSQPAPGDQSQPAPGDQQKPVPGDQSQPASGRHVPGTRSENLSTELIERFLKREPGVIKADQQTSLEGDVSEGSVQEDDSFITDTLAKIYVKQGLHAKAIYAYERLSLKYPEKSAYFAAQIEKIKNNSNV